MCRIQLKAYLYCTCGCFSMCAVAALTLFARTVIISVKNGLASVWLLRVIHQAGGNLCGP